MKGGQKTKEQQHRQLWERVHGRKSTRSEPGDLRIKKTDTTILSPCKVVQNLEPYILSILHGLVLMN